MYSKLEKIGQGTYGVVYMARLVSTKEIVAVKNISISSVREGIPCTALREIAVLKHLDHKNIVKVRKIAHTSGKIVIIFEYCKWDLKKYMKEVSRHIPFEDIVRFSYQLLQAIAYMHEKSIVHRDIKPQNLLITEDKILKVADFGLARCSNLPVENISLEVVTQWYRPPELMLGLCKDMKAIDMWSVGCVIAEMASSYPLFPCADDSSHLQEIFRVFGTPTELEWPGVWSLPKFPKNQKIVSGTGLREMLINCDPDLLSLIEGLLELNPSRRLSAAKALGCRVFDRVRGL